MLIKYLRSAMRMSKHRKPPSLPSLYLSKPVIKEISPRSSSVLSDWDADDEGFMSSGDLEPSRPLSLSIPTGPYCPRRPTLQEVLENTASPPWTLSAFMAYLSQNHCLETLEFTMDATRYTTHYQSMVERNPNTLLLPQTQDCEHVKMLWTKLVDAYIAPNAPREVNLPSDVRNHLMTLPYAFTPPDPAELEPAVKIIYELMDESVLVPFVNSVAPARPSEPLGSPWTSDESMMDTYMAGSLDERSLSPSRTRNQRDDTPPMSGADMVTQSMTGPSPRHSHHSHLTPALGRSSSSRLSAHLSGSSAASSAPEAPDSLTDDSTDSPSPSASAAEPMTPPNTPPTSDIGLASVPPGTSSSTIRPESSSWKRMGAKFGWRKGGRGSGSSFGGVRYREGSEESGSSGL